MIYISKFRSNDLNPSKGKQIEFNKTVIDNFFNFTDSEYVTTFECRSILQVDVKENIRVELKLSPSRGDYKIYQNSDSSKNLKDYFLETLHLETEKNLDDYFAIKKKNQTTYILYYIPKNVLFSNFFAIVSNDQFLFIPEESEKVENKQEALISRQIIFYGAPGTGKSHTINEQTEGESVIRTTFHPDSDYSTFVGAYKPTTKEVELRDVSGHKIIEDRKVVTEDRIVYEFVSQAFLQAYIKAWVFYAENEDAPKKQFLIIEEINRGNCAQIFGDLFQLLDRNQWGFSDYPINADKDMKMQLEKAFKGISINNPSTINAYYKGRDVVQEVLNGEVLLLPNNLFIWATMNTSDQSLFPIDSAFKRRWDWQYMPIAQGRDEAGNELKWAINVNGKKYSWWSFIEKINAQIGETTQSEDKKLGFFFCKAKKEEISLETFVGKVVFYLWNDVFKDYGFEGSIFKDEDNSVLSFHKFYKADLKGNAIAQGDKVELFLNNLGVELIEGKQEEE